MAQIDLSAVVKWFDVPEKDFTGIMIDPDPKIAGEQYKNCPPLTVYKLFSLMLLEIPTDTLETTRKLMKIYDSIEKSWLSDKIWKPSEDEIGKFEELLNKVTDPRYKTGRTMGFVVKTLETYRKHMLKDETKSHS
jgi:hypothetical protein